MEFTNDEFTLEIDTLGYKELADKVREMILFAETPFSIGISGRWGSGKTSLMKYVMASLGGEPLKHRMKYQTEILQEKNDYAAVHNEYSQSNQTEHVKTIWFNPWEHENSAEPMIGLLQEIRQHFSLWSKTRKESEKLLSTSFQVGLDLLGSLISAGKAGKAGSEIRATGEKYEQENFEHLERSQRFKLVFQEALKNLLGQDGESQNGNARLVVFIDDLDRCEQETIAKLLKEIKQYLSTHLCVFVFGYDRHHVETSLVKSFSKRSRETRSYLEKLFQNTIYIREPREEKVSEYAKTLMNGFSFVKQEDEEAFCRFIVSIIDPNPRRIKSYIRSLYFHITVSTFCSEEGTGISLDDLKKLALIGYLKAFHEGAYSTLENKPELLKDITAALASQDRAKCSSPAQYFFFLELRSHLTSAIPTTFIDVESRKSELENNPEKEEKFLREIYEMQGKHRNYETFMKEFNAHFLPANFENSDITKYL